MLYSIFSIVFYSINVPFQSILFDSSFYPVRVLLDLLTQRLIYVDVLCVNKIKPMPKFWGLAVAKVYSFYTFNINLIVQLVIFLMSLYHRAKISKLVKLEYL